MKDPFVCARCGQLEQSCCQLAPGTEEVCFPISKEEREHIKRCVPDFDFVEQVNTAHFIENLLRLFPDRRRDVIKNFPPGESHYRLDVDSKGRCVFLSDKGCIIPKENRPYYCRIFPFWVDETGCITALESTNCLAFKESESIKELFSALSSTHSDIRILFEKLKKAWGF